MSRVVIVFEDTTTGEIEFKITHIDGWNPGSPAHKLANQVVKMLDEQAASCRDLEVAPPLIEVTPSQILRG